MESVRFVGTDVHKDTIQLAALHHQRPRAASGVVSPARPNLSTGMVDTTLAFI